MAEYVCEIDERPCKHGTAWSVAEKREPIVRCRDCTYFSDRGDTCRWFAYQDSAFTKEEPAFVDPDGFCAWGERRHA